MAIHHATMNKAAKLGIEISEVDMPDGALAQADRFLHPKAKTALQAAEISRQLAAEYPALTLKQPDDEDHRFMVMFAAGDSGTTVPQLVLAPNEGVPTLASILDATTEMGLDPEQGSAEPEPDESEEKKNGTVVNARYREIYRERGNPSHCGDWIAKMLDDAFTVVRDSKIQFDHETFIEFLRANEVDMTGKWAQLPTQNSPGWQGRFRMNGRQKLEKVVAHRGTMVMGGEAHEVPADDLERLRTKHPEPKKRRKAQAQDTQEA